MKAFGHEETAAQKIVIIGGGNIGYSLAKKIDEEDKNITTHLIEFDKKRAEFLASNLNSVSITNGDALENEILDEVNISEAGNFIAVTNDDEVNILSSLLAKRAGAQLSGNHPQLTGCAPPQRSLSHYVLRAIRRNGTYRRHLQSTGSSLYTGPIDGGSAARSRQAPRKARAGRRDSLPTKPPDGL